MAFSLKDIIFDRFFTDQDTIQDKLKDGNGKGTLQRWVETHGEYHDDYLQPLIDDFVKNTVDPNECLDKFIEYLEYQLTADQIVLGSAEEMRRRVLTFALRFSTMRGTRRGMQVMYSMIGLTATITNIDRSYGLDSAITLDSPDRRLDSKCNSCGGVSIELVSTAGFAYTEEIQRVMENILTYHIPDDVEVLTYTLDGVAVLNWVGNLLENPRFEDGFNHWNRDTTFMAASSPSNDPNRIYVQDEQLIIADESNAESYAWNHEYILEAGDYELRFDYEEVLITGAGALQLYLEEVGVGYTMIEDWSTITLGATESILSTFSVPADRRLHFRTIGIFGMSDKIGLDNFVLNKVD